MFSEQELLDAIDECQNALPKTFSTCEKLAVFYTILDHLQGNEFARMMSRDPEPEMVIGDYGASEFFESIRGKESKKVWQVFGELMEALKVLNPKLYSRTIERLATLD